MAPNTKSGKTHVFENLSDPITWVSISFRVTRPQKYLSLQIVQKKGLVICSFLGLPTQY